MDNEKRQEIIDYITKSKLIEKCVDYQAKAGTEEFDNKDDIIQDTYLWILTYDPTKLEDAFDKKHLNALITAYLTRQLFSSKSPYYAKYKRFKNRTTNITKDTLNLPENYDCRFRAYTRGETESIDD